MSLGRTWGILLSFCLHYSLGVLVFLLPAPILVPFRALTRPLCVLSGLCLLLHIPGLPPSLRPCVLRSSQLSGRWGACVVARYIILVQRPSCFLVLPLSRSALFFSFPAGFIYWLLHVLALYRILLVASIMYFWCSYCGCQETAGHMLRLDYTTKKFHGLVSGFLCLLLYLCMFYCWIQFLSAVGWAW